MHAAGRAESSRENARPAARETGAPGDARAGENGRSEACIYRVRDPLSETRASRYNVP